MKIVNMASTARWIYVCIVSGLFSSAVFAEEALTEVSDPVTEPAIEQCVLGKFKSQDRPQTFKKLQQTCQSELAATGNQSAYEIRISAEKNEAFNPHVMLPHKMNYLLPISTTDNVNREVYQFTGDYGDNLKSTEAEFQISFKIPLVSEGLFSDDDGLAFGFTLQSWWQLYAQEISRPFRETNYQPEIFYYTPLSWQPAGGDTNLTVGFEHQSNGRSQLLSRSWNRLYAIFTFAKDDYVIAFRPWWKIPEGDKVTTIHESANDNPDIADYMGHFELMGAYQWGSLEFSLKGRENFSTHKGSLELGMTFPLTGRLKGFLQYSNGYGESLIDYDHSQQRIGIGFALTDIF